MSCADHPSRRAFLWRSLAAGVAAPLPAPSANSFAPSMPVVSQRIALALRHQERYAIGLDWLHVEQLVRGRTLRTSSASGSGPHWLHTAARLAVAKQRKSLETAEGVLLLVGVMPINLHRSDLAAARQIAREAAPSASVIYGVHPPEHPSANLTVTVLATWA